MGGTRARGNSTGNDSAAVKCCGEGLEGSGRAVACTFLFPGSVFEQAAKGRSGNCTVCISGSDEPVNKESMDCAVGF